MTPSRRLNEQLARTLQADPPVTGAVVCMFVRNHFEHDARVTREALALVENGLDVVIFAVAKTPEDIGVTRQGPLRIVRVFHHDTAVRRFVLSTLTFQRRYRRFSRRKAVIIRLPLRVLIRVLRPVGKRLDQQPPVAGTPESLPRKATFARRAARQLRKRARVPKGKRYVPVGARAIRGFRMGIKRLLWPAHRVLAAIYFQRITARMAASLDPIAYHCHDENTAMAGYLARKRHRAPYVYDSHELFPHRNRVDATRLNVWATEVVDRFFSRRADAVITVNRSIAEHMERRYKIPHVDVIMNTPAAAADPPPGAVTPSLDHVPRPRLFYSGNLMRNRGLEEAIQALALLPDCFLVPMGPDRTNYVEGMNRLASELGVQDRMYVIPPVPHELVSSVGAQADVGMVLFKPTCLSYRYSLPNKFFEALHAGLPVVASDLPELRRIVTEHDLGVLCDPEDPQSIADAVRSILSDPAGAARMRVNAKAAAERYRWENERETLVAIYRRLGCLPGAAEAPSPPVQERLAAGSE